MGTEIPDDFGYVTDTVREKSQADLAALVAGGIHLDVVEDVRAGSAAAQE